MKVNKKKIQFTVLITDSQVKEMFTIELRIQKGEKEANFLFNKYATKRKGKRSKTRKYTRSMNKILYLAIDHSNRNSLLES